MTPQQVLTEARRLIAEKGWAQRAYARRDNGDPCREDDRKAACFCASGALMVASWKVDTPDSERSRIRSRELFETAIGGGPIIAWNDHSSRSAGEVLSAFDKAIELAGAAK